MRLGLRVGDDEWNVGSPDLLHAFFAATSRRLEPRGWGSRFPALMNELYQGTLSPARVETALSELLLVRRELALVPAQRTGDTGPPPAVADGAPDASRSFVTDEGRDLFEVLLTALLRLRSSPEPLAIVETAAAYSPV